MRCACLPVWCCLLCLELALRIKARVAASLFVKGRMGVDGIVTELLLLLWDEERRAKVHLDSELKLWIEAAVCAQMEISRIIAEIWWNLCAVPMRNCAARRPCLWRGAAKWRRPMRPPEYWAAAPSVPGRIWARWPLQSCLQVDKSTSRWLMMT